MLERADSTAAVASWRCAAPATILRRHGPERAAGVGDQTVRESPRGAAFRQRLRKMRRLPNAHRGAGCRAVPSGGCGLATACDIVLATESAQFGYPECSAASCPRW